MNIDPILIIASALNCDPSTITENSALGTHPQWDSFGHVTLMVALADTYGIVIDDETTERYQNIANILVLHQECSALTGIKAE